MQIQPFHITSKLPTYSGGQNRGQSPVYGQLQEPRQDNRFYFASPVYSPSNCNASPSVRPGYLLDRYI